LVRAVNVEKSSEVVGFNVGWYELDDIVRLIRNGEIMHSPTIIGILMGRERGYFEF
jgi:hypothetical protein